MSNLSVSTRDSSPTLVEVIEILENKRRSIIANKLVTMRPKLKRRKRELSNHICSRFYRAPEIILLTNTYDFKVDMWGVGCIVAELILLTRKTNGPLNFPLRGVSCYPLSASDH